MFVCVCASLLFNELLSRVYKSSSRGHANILNVLAAPLDDYPHSSFIYAIPRLIWLLKLEIALVVLDRYNSETA